MNKRFLPLMAVVLIVAMMLTGGCKDKVVMQMKAGDGLPTITTAPAETAPQVVVPDGPVAGQVTVVFVNIDGVKWFVHASDMINATYLELPGVKKNPALKTGHDEQAYLVDGVGISQGDNLWLVEPQSYNFDEAGKEHITFAAGTFRLVPHDKGTLADAIVAARKDKSIGTKPKTMPNEDISVAGKG